MPDDLQFKNRKAAIDYVLSPANHAPEARCGTLCESWADKDPTDRIWWLNSAAYFFSIEKNFRQLREIEIKLINHPENVVPITLPQNKLYDRTIWRVMTFKQKWSAFYSTPSTPETASQELKNLAEELVQLNSKKVEQELGSPSEVKYFHLAMLARSLVAFHSNNPNTQHRWNITMNHYLERSEEANLAARFTPSEIQKLQDDAERLIKEDLKLASHLALNYNLQQRAPAFCATLCRLLAKRPEEKEKESWEKCTLYCESRLGFFSSAVTQLIAQNLRLPSWYW